MEERERKINEVLPFFYGQLLSYWESGGSKPQKIKKCKIEKKYFLNKIVENEPFIPSNSIDDKEYTNVCRCELQRAKYSNSSAASYISDLMSYSFNLLLKLDGFEKINPILVSEEAAWAYSKIKNISKNDAAKALSKTHHKEQGKVLGDTKRDGNKIFHWEHAFSRSTFVYYMTLIEPPEDLKNISNEEEQRIKKSVFDLIGQHQIVWVTSPENKNIGKVAGYIRPKEVYEDSWRTVYGYAGVKIYGE